MARRRFPVRFDLQPAPEGGIRLANVHLDADAARELADEIHDIIDSQVPADGGAAPAS